MSSVLITGGASGLGEAITRRFASFESYEKIYFTFFKSKKIAEQIEHECPNTKAIACDFTDEASVSQLLSLMSELSLDILINNAIVSMHTKHFHRCSPDDFISSFAHNVLPTLRITQQAILGFRKKKSGKIITILTSYLANRPPVGLSEYVANKAYLLSLSKSWAEENARFNITSNCVSPSLMQTNLTVGLDERQIEDIKNATHLKTLLAVDEVADTIHFLANATPHINGVNILINGGMNVV